MANPTIHTFTATTLANLQTLTGSVDRETVELLGYYSENDGGGGLFYWDVASTDSPLYSLIVQATGVTQGRWIRIFDSYIDVKWFGAHQNQSASVNSIGFQAALDYFKLYPANTPGRKNINLFISKGIYNIDTPLSVQIADKIYDSGRVMIYGAGAEETTINYTGSSSAGAVFTLKGYYNYITELKDFSINDNFFNYQKNIDGIRLQNLSSIIMQNIMIWGFRIGMDLQNVLTSRFTNLALRSSGVAGIKGNIDANLAIDPANPNLLNFSNCLFHYHQLVAVHLLDMHSVTFDSCDFEQNGSSNTPLLTNPAGVDCTFLGSNGANGLNVTGCYFENNIGLADIRVEVQNNAATGAYCTHTFKGNTFNRNVQLINNKPAYTNNNILIVGSGQSPKRLFSQSKCKLVFEGNGFFVNDPTATNNYQPDPSRRAIRIDYASLNYWEFDVVEQGNTYPGIKDAPTYADPGAGIPMAFSDLMPQISEYTRVKAFGLFLLDRESLTFTALNSYNIKEVKRLFVGTYEIVFANALQNAPVPTISFVDVPESSPWGILGSFRYYTPVYPATSVTIDIFDFPGGHNVDNSFSIVVY